MSEEQGSRPTRRSPVEIAELLDDFEKSGLNRIAFCHSRGISKNTLDLYRKRKRQSEKARSNTDLVPVKLTSAKPSTSNASDLTVVLQSGRRIEVKRGFDAGVLTQLVELLERA
jgi:hypothetical protein